MELYMLQCLFGYFWPQEEGEDNIYEGFTSKTINQLTKGDSSNQDVSSDADCRISVFSRNPRFPRIPFPVLAPSPLITTVSSVACWRQSFKIGLPGSTHKSALGITNQGLLCGKTWEVFLKGLGVCKSLRIGLVRVGSCMASA